MGGTKGTCYSLQWEGNTQYSGVCRGDEWSEITSKALCSGVSGRLVSVSLVEVIKASVGVVMIIMIVLFRKWHLGRLFFFYIIFVSSG